MRVSYYRAWFRARKIACEPLTQDGVLQAYAARTLYTVVVGDPQRPDCFIECNEDFVGVEFLDTFLRRPIAYELQEKKPGKLFLSMAVRRYYVGDTDKVKCGAAFLFEENGTTVVNREDFVAGILERAKVHIDVSHNWAAYPRLGDYSALIDRSRERSWGDLWETCLDTMR